MIVHSPVLAPSIRPKHRRFIAPGRTILPVGEMSQAQCEGLTWETLNCTARCPRHWPIGYSAHGRHRSDRQD